MNLHSKGDLDSLTRLERQSTTCLRILTSDLPERLIDRATGHSTVYKVLYFRPPPTASVGQTAVHCWATFNASGSIMKTNSDSAAFDTDLCVIRDYTDSWH